MTIWIIFYFNLNNDASKTTIALAHSKKTFEIRNIFILNIIPRKALSIKNSQCLWLEINIGFDMDKSRKYMGESF